MKILMIGFGKSMESALNKVIINKFDICGIISFSGKDISKIKSISKKFIIPLKIVRNRKDLEEEIFKFKFDLIVTCSCPFLLSKRILMLPAMGIINIHGSLLPKYRGYHPVHWALINDEKETGVSIHYVNEKIDSGKLISQKKININNNDDINTLIERISKTGAMLLVDVLNQIKNKKHIETYNLDNNHGNLFFARKRYERDGRINWKKNTREIYNLVRALREPYPNAYLLNQKSEKIKVLDSHLDSELGKVISKIEDSYLVTTADGVILIKTDKRLKIGEILK